MTNRITDQILDNDVAVVNGMLGFTDDDRETYGLPGFVTLGKAYGGVRVEQYVGPAGSGGIIGLSDGFQTKREAHNFLRGMIAALRAAQDRNAR